MAINVSHEPNQRLFSALQYLAGFGKSRQDVKMQEAKQQALQNQQLFGGIGQGIGNAVSGYASRSADLNDQQARFAQQTALANLGHQNDMAMLKQRDATDTYQKQAELYTRLYGESPGATSLGGMDFQSLDLQGGQPQTQSMGGGEEINMDGGPMTAPQQPQGGVPMPVFNPGMAADFKRAQNELHKLSFKRDLILSNPHITMPDRQAQAAAMEPRIQQLQQLTSRYPQPKPPSSEEELIQAGIVIPATDGGQWYQSGPNKWSKAQAAGKPQALDYYSMPPQEQESHLQRVFPDGGLEKIRANPNLVIKVKANGEADVEELTKGGSKDDGGGELFKAAITNSGKNSAGETVPFDRKQVMKNYEELAEAKELVQKKVELEKELNEALARPPMEGVSEQELGTMVREAVQTFGRDGIPADLQEKFKQLDARLHPKGTRRLISGPR